MLIRDSADADLTALHRIYAHHVLTGPASFEEVPPDVEEMARRRREILDSGLPYLAASEAGRVLGYAYAGPYRTRSAYRYSLEDSVYIDEAAVGRGIGGLLLAELLSRTTALGYRQMVAVIGGPQPASVALHARLGFAHAGRLPAIGFKFGRWLDSVLMTRALGEGSQTLPP